MKQSIRFDFCIGNPPYQAMKQDTSDNPVYHEFMNAAFEVVNKVELITPARFLFNAGKTPKEWNEKMLSDSHLKVLYFEQDSSKVFANTDIKGGIVVTYRDRNKTFGAINVFTSFPELNSLLSTMTKHGEYVSLSSIVYSQSSYGISQAFHKNLPSESRKLKQSAKKFFASNVFDVLANNVFYDERPNDGNDYIQLFGRHQNNRVYKWIKREYVLDPGNLNMWKVFLPKSNGSGAIGEVLSTPMIGHPMIGHPMIGHTQSFISIGSFETEEEALATMKYIKTKFARTLLGILKITQDNPPEKWKYVPLQNFTSVSDIDWSKSIAEIDQQLYKKYGLSPDEIAFIETHVKEMK